MARLLAFDIYIASYISAYRPAPDVHLRCKKTKYGVGWADDQTHAAAPTLMCHRLALRHSY
jgi:hypothetical protein